MLQSCLIGYYEYCTIVLQTRVQGKTDIFLENFRVVHFLLLYASPPSSEKPAISQPIQNVNLVEFVFVTQMEIENVAARRASLPFFSSQGILAQREKAQG